MDAIDPGSVDEAPHTGDPDSIILKAGAGPPNGARLDP